MHVLYETHGLDTQERICFYEQDFYVFSNFSSFQLQWKGILFQTSEHAYHWEKFSDENIRKKIIESRSAHDAFQIAQNFKVMRRKDWDSVKVDIMRNILREKVIQHPYVQKKLYQSGNRVLVENSWRDGYWGEGKDGKGLNMLGKLWMEVREELMECKGVFTKLSWVPDHLVEVMSDSGVLHELHMRQP